MTSQAVSRSIQQQRAHYALALVSRVTSEESDVQKCFKAYSNSLPAMIQMNGIGQALAFAWQKSNGDRNKESTAWTLLFRAVSDWLLKERSLWASAGHDHVVHALAAGSQEQYQLAQAEAQALLAWVKDFARAEIVGERGVE
jgi:CRISPR-associated protein Cmr5